ncbi:MAG TPA: RNA 2',3'-cyclic phosphodiesterase [Bryobacterales bacterium]|nr:RNA 2',3'-cyclic phosphodiesterase [Bryobacterales bacterium]
MRLFAALDLSREVEAKLVELLERLRPAAKLRWSPAENLHLTLKFIGEFPGERLEELRAALGGVAMAPIEARVAGLGFFPNARGPRVFWAGVEAGAELAELAARIEAALEPLGIAREKRAYSPHLTLARVPEDARLDGLRETIGKLQEDGAVAFGAFRAERFYLYESTLAAGGSVYTRIAEFGGPPR